jgi:rubrerythrin
MTLEDAIKTAIEYEIKIRDVYKEAAENAIDPVGKRVFKLLRDDEQHHVDYLNHKLGQWQKTGRISVEKLRGKIPSRDVLAEEVDKLQTTMAQDDRKMEKQMLSKALQVEIETSNFYKQMVDQMSDEGQQMFAHFLEIENDHIILVQAELDYLSKSGFWFDSKEFDMEGY